MSHHHASLDRAHWTENVLRAHLRREIDDDGHGVHSVRLGAWAFDPFIEHVMHHPEGDDRQVPEVLLGS